MKYNFLCLSILCISLNAYSQSNNIDAELMGNWRIFKSESDVTAVLRSTDNTADMDLFCDKSHFELSIYLKKPKEGGELTAFNVLYDNSEAKDIDWQANNRTRSVTVKTSSPKAIAYLSGHKAINVSYTIKPQSSKTVEFTLDQVFEVIEKANQVCQLDLAQYNLAK